jgi:hypothetical protein
VEDGLADGLRGDGTGVERDAADELATTFDDGDAPILFGGGDGGFLARGTAANDNEVVSHIVDFL